MKTCTQCGQTKPLDDFGKRETTKDELQYNCKTCRKAISDAYADKSLIDIIGTLGSKDFWGKP